VIKNKILSMWTIYFNPADFPGRFVARRFVVMNGISGSTNDAAHSETKGGVIAWIKEDALRFGVVPVRLSREPGDDPVIVETWI